jgi:hypothetical protein
VHALLQHAPALHAPLVHVVNCDSKKHPCASCAHVANVDVDSHAFPTTVHVELTLHVHAATSALVVQLWCAPHATAGAYAQQPSVPSVHVSRPPVTHNVWPDVQLLVQVSAHFAFGGAPTHDSGDAHACVDAAKKQPFASLSHVATVPVPSHAVPISMQTVDGLHVHVAAKALPVQLWWAPHATGVPRAEQPLIPCVQVARSPETHDACPLVQLLLHVSEHAAPRPPSPAAQVSGDVQVTVDATSRQPFASFAHVATVWASWHTAPVVVQIVEVQPHAAMSPVTAHVW